MFEILSLETELAIQVFDGFTWLDYKVSKRFAFRSIKRRQISSIFRIVTAGTPVKETGARVTKRYHRNKFRFEVEKDVYFINLKNSEKEIFLDVSAPLFFFTTNDFKTKALHQNV